ncbi:hypothetical protein [Sphingobacterium daejeonense]|uniref:hypothetical protein n=1 Tax=Sphingobacterium daejeonense TaxID=371142 RepID=UPI0010C3C1F4|nr:hypothetical protein [Sphingobacterium daejeonense]VTQ01646.1 Uncharacterised protein [Sphingobacterium daejeonense]
MFISIYHIRYKISSIKFKNETKPEKLSLNKMNDNEITSLKKNGFKKRSKTRYFKYGLESSYFVIYKCKNNLQIEIDGLKIISKPLTLNEAFEIYRLLYGVKEYW